MSKYTNRVYSTEPDYSKLSLGDVILTEIIIKKYIDWEEKEIDTKQGTQNINVQVEKTKSITIYYVVSASNYQQMLEDFPYA